MQTPLPSPLKIFLESVDASADFEAEAREYQGPRHPLNNLAITAAIAQELERGRKFLPGSPKMKAHLERLANLQALA